MALKYTKDIKSKLLSLRYKSDVNEFIKWIAGDPTKFKALMDCFFDDNLRVCQKASWPVLHLGIKHPKLIKPYLSKMVKNLDQAPHDAVVRNTVRIFQDIDIPNKLSGELYEKCFGYLVDIKSPIAVKCFSMSILAKLAYQYPELSHELVSVIEEQLPYASAGFKSRAKKLLPGLRKMVK